MTRHKEIDYELSMIMLEAQKVGTRFIVSPQVLHNLNLKKHYEPISRNMVFNLSTTLYKSQTQEQPKEVKFRKSIMVYPPRGALYISIFLCVMFFVLALLDDSRILFAFPLAFVPALAPYFGFKKYVKGKVEISRQDWATFPENNALFPEKFGKPVFHTTYTKRIKELE